MKLSVLYKIESGLHSIFIMVWMCAVLLFLFYLFLRNKNITGYVYVAVAVIGYIILNILVTWFIDQHLRLKFKHLDSVEPYELLLRFDAKLMKLSEKSEIVKFFDSINKSATISAQHSHPREKYYFSVNNDDYTYSIAYDSKLEDGFWLSDESCPNCRSGRVLKRFRSKELSTFLNALRTEQYTDSR